MRNKMNFNPTNKMSAPFILQETRRGTGSSRGGGSNIPQIDLLAESALYSK